MSLSEPNLQESLANYLDRCKAEEEQVDLNVVQKMINAGANINGYKQTELNK